ncbi:MAG: methylmalonyl-CoA/ethylmalonyl-CoA epimerase [Pseudonocardiales bacterium]|nr:methylmalonyl-CoA/ethylmalonyl-CoA epimerase [Pseudonocardiales bacterium]
MIIGIDHIGLATEDPGGVAAFLTALGLGKDDEGIAESYGVACEFWSHPSAGGQPAIELVTPVREDSALSDHFTRRLPSLYHVAFEVDDLDAELARLRGHRLVPVDAEPCAGARPGMRVAFMYVPKPAALLIELVQYGVAGAASAG